MTDRKSIEQLSVSRDGDGEDTSYKGRNTVRHVAVNTASRSIAQSSNQSIQPIHVFVPMHEDAPCILASQPTVIPLLRTNGFQCCTHLSPWLLERVYRSNLPRITHTDHIRSESHDGSMPSVQRDMLLVSFVALHPQQAGEVRKFREEGAGNVGEPEIGSE